MVVASSLWGSFLIKYLLLSLQLHLSHFLKEGATFFSADLCPRSLGTTTTQKRVQTYVALASARSGQVLGCACLEDGHWGLHFSTELLSTAASLLTFWKSSRTHPSSPLRVRSPCTLGQTLEASVPYGRLSAG